MSNAPKFRKKAVEFEQLKQFDRAVASYVRAIEENENAGEEVDVALFNKVGDLTLRGGRVIEAVTYYERAVEHYVTNNLFDNAIALCNKILRNAPGRSNVYFTLGRICGRKGLRSDATRNFLEYATRMQQEGRIDEGMRALAEVADLMPELTEVGRLVEEHAARAGIALRRRVTPNRNIAQAADAPKNMFGMSKDLVFLDIDYDAPNAAAVAKPVPSVVEAKTKTASLNIVPPPALDEGLSAQPLAFDEDAFAHIEASEIVSIDEVDEDALFADEAELNAIELEIRNSITPELVAKHSDETDSIFDGMFETPTLPAGLEGLAIFEPSAELPQGDSDASQAVVDGASILIPFVDPATPLPSLAGLEPNDINATPPQLIAVAAAEASTDFSDRGAPEAQARSNPTPVFVSAVSAPVETPAVAEIATDTDDDDNVFGAHANHDTIVVGSADIVNYAAEQELLAEVAIDALDGITSEAERKLVLASDDSTVLTHVRTTNDVPVIPDPESLAGLDVDTNVAQAEQGVDRVWRSRSRRI